MELIFAVGFSTKIELKYHCMIFDFGKLKNSISCSCIFRKSITSHTKLCNSVRHFWGLMLCIQTLSQRQSCVSVSQSVSQSVSIFEDEKTRDRSPRVFIIWQVDWVLVIIASSVLLSLCKLQPFSLCWEILKSFPS